jgi:hypothetical protein
MKLPVKLSASSSDCKHFSTMGADVEGKMEQVVA